jgi:hypothetical protein
MLKQINFEDAAGKTIWKTAARDGTYHYIVFDDDTFLAHSAIDTSSRHCSSTACFASGLFRNLETTPVIDFKCRAKFPRLHY